MAQVLTRGGGQDRAPAAATSRSTAGTPLLWGGIIALLVVTGLTVRGESLRLNFLQVVLVASAVGEAVGGTLGVFRPRWFAEQNGRPYDPAYHGVSQDFGFYNLTTALLFALAAVDPKRLVGVIVALIALYAGHGVTHIFRYFGLYYGGGGPIPTRTQQAELRDGLTLLASVTGMVLFFP